LNQPEERQRAGFTDRRSLHTLLLDNERSAKPLDEQPKRSKPVDFHPVPPTITVAPEVVAEDTYLVHQVQPALGAPLNVYINSMVIRGDEPVVVDTGTVANRRQWLEDTFSLVDPVDVRYVFISHDDIDHTGNLAEVMALCSNATLIASWSLVERHTNAFDFPLARCRWMNDGDHIDLADRRLTFVRPPVFDSPTTRGVHDSRTGVYWAADCFAAPCSPALEADVADFDQEFWGQGMAMFGHHALSPWLAIVEPSAFSCTVDKVRSLDPTTIASAHSPVITGKSVARAIDMVRALPTIPAPPLPDQRVLDAILAELPAA
jgi:flavorubredoxin